MVINFKVPKVLVTYLQGIRMNFSERSRVEPESNVVNESSRSEKKNNNNKIICAVFFSLSWKTIFQNYTECIHNTLQPVSAMVASGDINSDHSNVLIYAKTKSIFDYLPCIIIYILKSWKFKCAIYIFIVDDYDILFVAPMLAMWPR